MGQECNGNPHSLQDELRRSNAWVDDEGSGSEIGPPPSARESFSASASEWGYARCHDDSSTVSDICKRPAKSVPAKKPAGRMDMRADGSRSKNCAKGSSYAKGSTGGNGKSKSHAKGSSCGASTGERMQTKASSASKPMKTMKAKKAKK